MLVKGGYVEENYVEVMIECDNMIFIYMGNDVVILYGMEEVKKNVLRFGFIVI